MARSLRCHPENEAQSPSPNMEEFAALPPPVRFGKSEDHGTRFAFDCVARLLNAVARQSQPSREAVRGTSYQELPRDSGFARAVNDCRAVQRQTRPRQAEMPRGMIPAPL